MTKHKGSTPEEKTLSRRDLLRGGAIVAAGLAATGAMPTMGYASQAGESSEGSTGAEEAPAGFEDRVRPEPNSGKRPSPIHTGYTGPDAKPIEPVAEPSSWDEEYDVVIVGSGYGGLTAANILASAGKSVALIEKDDVTGGASRHAAYNGVLGGGTKAQEEMGYHWPGETYDPKEAAEYFEELYSYSIDQNLLIAAIQGNADWADWMSEQPGIDWVCTGDSYVDSQLADGTYNSVLGNTRICDALTENAEKAGVNIQLLTECEALVWNNDKRVTGLKVSDVNGSEKYLKGKDAVLLTAGGFGMNLDLLEKYIPAAYMHATQGGPMPSHTGECFRMGLGAGADVSGFNTFGVWENGLDEYYGNGDGEWFHYFFDGGLQVVQGAWFRVDKAGNRLPYFVLNASEKQDGVRPLMNGFWQNGDLTNCSAWGSSIGHCSYAFFDSNFPEYMEKMRPTYASFDMHRAPEFPEQTREQCYFDTDWKVGFDKRVANGGISKADTIEELAEMLGLEPAKVKEQIDHWNEICAQGEDTELLTPYRKEWLNPIDTPPYYGFGIGFRVCKTLCGLRVNPKMQVIKDDATAIPGLFAGWHTAGGISGESTYCCIGTNGSVLGGCAISGVGGYLAAQAILEGEE